MFQLRGEEIRDRMRRDSVRKEKGNHLEKTRFANRLEVWDDCNSGHGG